MMRPDKYRRKYVLTEDYVFTTQGKTIRIPKGFAYNGASIPKIFWWAFYSPFDPIVMEPALPHDYLYSFHKLSKEEADTLFRYHLRDSHVPPWKATLMYWAVRLFGGRAYRRGDRAANGNQ